MDHRQRRAIAPGAGAHASTLLDLMSSPRHALPRRSARAALVALTAVLSCSRGDRTARESLPAAERPDAALASGSAEVVAAGLPMSAAPTAKDAGGDEGSRVAPTKLEVRAVPLPGATAPAALDYIACETRPDGECRVWVPAGGSGRVDVFDPATGTFRQVDGFKTAEREHDGVKRIVGPSSVAIGDAYAYVGNRAIHEVCAIDLKTLARGPCQGSRSAVDGVAWVRSTRQVWVTLPSEGALDVFDAASDGTLKLAGTVRVGGEPEGYASDETRGLFFTNLEDKSKTVVVDVATRQVQATWDNACGPEGPRGIAVDSASNLVMVACTDRIQVLDGGHGGALLTSLRTGAGVDNIDYVSAHRTLYVAAGKAARLSVIQVGPRGELTIAAMADTRSGARNAVADAAGHVFIADPKGASLLVASPVRE